MIRKKRNLIQINIPSFWRALEIRDSGGIYQISKEEKSTALKNPVATYM